MSDDGINSGRSGAMDALAACIDEAAEVTPIGKHMSDDPIISGRTRAMAAAELNLEPATVIFDEVAGVDPASFDKLAERIRQGGLKHGEVFFITGGMRLGKTNMLRKMLDEQGDPFMVVGPSEFNYEQWLSKMNASRRLEVHGFADALCQVVPVPEEIDQPPKKPIRHGPQAVRKGKVKRW